MGPKDVALANRDGVSQSDELTWFDRLHTRIESLIDVESGHAPSILLDTGRYLETHVHAVGSNVRKLCADFVRELLMPVPNDPISEHTPSVVRSTAMDLTASEVTPLFAQDKPTVQPKTDSAVTAVKTPRVCTSQDSTTPDRKLRLADCCPVPVEDEHRDEIVALRVEALLQQKTPQETVQRGPSPALPPSGKKQSVSDGAISSAVEAPFAVASMATIAGPGSKNNGAGVNTVKAMEVAPSSIVTMKGSPARETAAPSATLSTQDSSDSEDLPEISQDDGERADNRAKDAPVMIIAGEAESDNEGRGLWFDDIASTEYRRKVRIGRSTSASSLGSAAGRSDASPGQDFLEWEFL